MNVLYEDNHCIVVVKPHGMPTQADQSGDPCFLEDVRTYIKEMYHKPGDAFVGLVHRLDRPVGGVMVFAKTSKGAERLSKDIREGSFHKIYWAVVEGAPKEKEGEVIQWLKKNEATNYVTAFSRETEDAKKAELSYRVLKSDGKQSLIEITPRTGRSHQIRVAMKTLGVPILGDTKYGAKESLQGNIALFAKSLSFHKPVGGEIITVTTPPTFLPFMPFLK